MRVIVFFYYTAPIESCTYLHTVSLHAALPIYLPAAWIDVIDQPVPVERRAVGHHRVDAGQSEGTAEVTGQVIETAGILQFLRRQGAERDDIDRHDAEHQGCAAHDLRDQQLVELQVGGDMRHHPGDRKSTRLNYSN